MKCQTLFSGGKKNKKNIKVPSAEIAYRLVTVLIKKIKDMMSKHMV